MRTERMRMVVALAVVAAMGVTLVGTPAQALLVKNDGNTIFDSGGFEGETAGFNPTNATVGSWSSIYRTQAGGAPATTWLVNDAASPGPDSGANYLTVDKQGLPNAFTINAVFSATANSGDVSMEWKTYVDSSDDSGLQYYLLSGSHSPGTGTGFRGPQAPQPAGRPPPRGCRPSRPRA